MSRANRSLVVETPKRRQKPIEMGNPSAGVDLHAAARSGDLSAVQAILGSNPLSVNSRDKHSRTPLHLAAWSGQAEVVSYLCKHKADVGAAAMDDMGAMHFAAQKGHLEVVKTLLSSGVSVKASTRKGLTSLHYAAQGSNLELVKYLVKKGSNLMAKTKAGKTPLDLAKNQEIISFLEECESSHKNGESNNKQGAEEAGSKTSAEEAEENSGAESPAAEVKGGEDETAKRKGDEYIIGEASSEPKKARVKLSHLMSADDISEDETL